MSYVYILKSLNHKKLYVGSTNNLERRLSEHNNGFSFYTKRYKPWSVIYLEEYRDINDARKRERYLKSSAGRRFIKKNVSIPG
jgi:putative endonuclease